jgi:hypothetical protein
MKQHTARGDLRKRLESRPTEEREAAVVVRKVATRVSIDADPVEIVLGSTRSAIETVNGSP